MILSKIKNALTRIEHGRAESPSSPTFDAAKKIRILVLDPGEAWSEYITATFRFITLENYTPASSPGLGWQALSYAWEGQSTSKSITLDGKRTGVTENVFAMLQNLRHSTEKRSLWIDALCISQSDDDEKSLQVAMMRDVYQKAESVMIWLPGSKGSALSDVAAAARWLDKGLDEHTKSIKEPLLTCFKRQSSAQHGSIPFHEVLRLAWFRRVWVVQEAVLARRLLIRLGDDVLPWDVFATAVLRFMSYLEAKEALETPLAKCYDIGRDAYFDDPTRLGLSLVGLITTLRECVRSSTASIGPSELVPMCRDCLSTLQVDMVYAVSGLFGLTGPAIPRKERFQIDYKVPVPEVYQSFTVWCIEQEQTLDILAQQRYEEGDNERLDVLPTWAANWSNLALNEFNVAERCSMLSKISRPLIKPKHTPKCHRRGRYLVLKGYILGDIESCRPSAFTPLPYGVDSSLETENREKLLDTWLQSIPDDEKANRLVFGEKRPTRARLQGLYNTTMEKEHRISHLWRDGAQLPEDETRVSYRIATITEHGWLAVTFRYFTGVGKLCCLTGGRGLFVLRPRGPEPLTGDLMYSIISGDCFVEGFEDGKGVSMARKLGFKEQDITLC